MDAVAARRKIAAETPKTAGTSSAPADAEVRDAIRRVFLFDGLMIVKHLYTVAGIGRYRVNWFRDSGHGPYIHEARFLLVGGLNGSLDIQDATAA
jgi:hypothetical protein